MVRPRSSAKGRSVSVASSAMRDRSTCFSGEGPLVGAAEQEQCFGEVDRSGVDGVEAVDELAVVAVHVLAGHVEKCLRDRQRGAQLVGGVGCESLLLGDLCFESCEHGVEGVGELAELIAAARQPDSVGERPGRGHACGVGDAGQGGEHPAGEKPPSQETEHEQERQQNGRWQAEAVQGVGAVGWEPREAEDHPVGDVSQEGEPHDHEHQGTGNHEEPGVAEGELEANAQPGGSIHRPLPPARCPVGCRCGTRRRPRWR